MESSIFWVQTHQIVIPDRINHEKRMTCLQSLETVLPKVFFWQNRFFILWSVINKITVSLLQIISDHFDHFLPVTLEFLTLYGMHIIESSIFWVQTHQIVIPNRINRMRSEFYVCNRLKQFFLVFFSQNGFFIHRQLGNKLTVPRWKTNLSLCPHKFADCYQSAALLFFSYRFYFAAHMWRIESTYTCISLDIFCGAEFWPQSLMHEQIRNCY